MDLDIIHNEDCLETLKRLPDQSINCCVTSPPYYGLRDYGTAKWEGGEPNCDHKSAKLKSRYDYSLESSPIQDGNKKGTDAPKYMNVCPDCGAIRIDNQIGLEETPEAYVQKIVEVFREVKRVLKDDGTLWLNLGDSYWGGNQAWTTSMVGKRETINGQQHQIATKGETIPTDRKHENIKPKDLIGIPWMVAFALRADGWYLRQDIIWCLSGGTWVYAKTQKGEMPMMIRDLYRLNPQTVKLWNGEKWTQLLGINKSERKGDEIELVLRSGERISCTPTHKFPTYRGLLQANNIQKGDILQYCVIPEPEIIKDCAIDKDAAWLAGLYIAEGSKSEDTIQIAGHSKEKERWNKVQMIAQKYGGYCTKTIHDNNMDIRIYGKVINAILNELVSGKTAKDKCFAPVVWKYSNDFIKSMLDGYLSGDGHWDKANNRWRIGFCRNYNLERDLRTACARLGYHLILNTSFVKYNGGNNPAFRGEIRIERSGHFNQKNPNEVIAIRKARCRYVYDLGVENKPHLFSLASGILTHNSKPNPMPESVTDRCTKAHEYIFLLSKSQRYYYDVNAIKEKCLTNDNSNRDRDNTKLNNTPGRTKMKGLKTNNYEKANKRSVWTVNTKPYKEAHFATYPEKLIVDCIKAGCLEGGIVYDPFMGAGTTALVAYKLNRKFIGSELNSDYAKIAEKRLKPYLSQHKIFDSFQ